VKLPYGFQPVAVERGADECGHREFGGGGGGHTVLPERLSRPEAGSGADRAALPDGGESRGGPRRAASWTRRRSRAGTKGGSRISFAGRLVQGEVQIPHGTGFVGINSMIRHSVAANPYSDVRIGAFMGKKIINDIRARTGRGALDYLTELSLEEFRSQYASEMPEEFLGSKFLAQHKTHDDPVTKIQPDATYRVVGSDAASHRGERAGTAFSWRRCTRRSMARKKSLVAAGECMYGAHEGYRDNCRLSTDEVDFLVESVRKTRAEDGAIRREDNRRRHGRHGGGVRETVSAPRAHPADRGGIFAAHRGDAGYF